MEAVKYAKPLKINRKENLKNHKWYWIGRRTQDVILSLLALVVLSPVMLITAIAIMIDDPSAGPIFSQIRIGRNGKPFKFYKFRSMCANAEAKLDDLLDQNEMDGPVFKIKEDPACLTRKYAAEIWGRNGLGQNGKVQITADTLRWSMETCSTVGMYCYFQ